MTLLNRSGVLCRNKCQTEQKRYCCFSRRAIAIECITIMMQMLRDHGDHCDDQNDCDFDDCMA